MDTELSSLSWISFRKISAFAEFLCSTCILSAEIGACSGKSPQGYVLFPEARGALALKSYGVSSLISFCKLRKMK